MELLELLKQFKNIEPDAGFTKRSRNLILRERGDQSGIFSAFKNTLEVGASLALAGLMVFVILGGLASVRFFQPFEIAALDPANIRAEADAIDIQIQLANLDYEESASPSPERGSTVSFTPGNAGKQTEPAPGDEEPAPLSIDEALKLLSN
jgi:hypothetical protein